MVWGSSRYTIAEGGCEGFEDICEDYPLIFVGSSIWNACKRCGFWMTRESRFPTTNEDDTTDDQVYKGQMGRYDLGYQEGMEGSFTKEVQGAVKMPRSGDASQLVQNVKTNFDPFLHSATLRRPHDVMLPRGSHFELRHRFPGSVFKVHSRSEWYNSREIPVCEDWTQGPYPLCV